MPRIQRFHHFHQTGYSTFTLLFLVTMFSATAYVGVKLAPSYIDFQMLANAMDKVAESKSIDSYRKKEIVQLIRKKTTVQIDPVNLDLDQVTSVFVRDGKMIVRVNYEIIVPLVKNASALLHFAHESKMQSDENTAQIQHLTKGNYTRAIVSN